MKFNEQWLREWVNPSVTTPELAHQLTMAGLEVDSVSAAAPDFNGVVVGAVLEVAPHPDADRLRVCKVDVGAEAPLNIVCGAPNVHVGMRAPTATLGATLPSGFQIKRAKLRGVSSEGMLCSAVELGIAETSNGLLPLPADAPIGMDVREYLHLQDSIIEVDLTPNRGDCLSVEGIAREVGVLNRCPVSGPPMVPVPASIEDRFPVSVDDAAGCPRYTGRVIKGIDPDARTPLWMQERLRRSGLRSISSVVDVTNYVMIELGQPMHAFDLAVLDRGIRVRRARAGEQLELLDGQQLTLDTDTLVIADEHKAQAIAGVMGGVGSGVAAGTSTVFFESAYFEPIATAARARRYGLHTDSSHRFERGVDPELQVRALERATQLLLEIAGGAAGPVIEVAHPAALPQRPAVTLRHQRVARVLGAHVPAATIDDLLARLGLASTPIDGGWQVSVPSYRFDIEQEIDLIEEVGRIYGYGVLPSAAPVATLTAGDQPEAVVSRERMQVLLVDRGYQEAVTYSFVDPALQRRVAAEPEPLALANPISADLAVMRTSLWPGLLTALKYNQNRQEERVRLFEIGLRFLPQTGGLAQEPMLAGVASGTAHRQQWGLPSRPVDFFDVKSDVEALLALSGCGAQFQFSRSGHPALHPGQAAAISRDGAIVGHLGLLHPALQRELDIAGAVVLFELQVRALAAGRVPAFRELSRFPAVRRDLAIVVAEEVTVDAVRACLAEASGELLEEIRFFDVYRGKGIDPGRKSVALGLTLREPSRTLTDGEVNGVMERVLGRLQADLGATLRE